MKHPQLLLFGTYVFRTNRVPKDTYLFQSEKQYCIHSYNLILDFNI